MSELKGLSEEKPVEKPGEEKPIEEKPIELSAMAKKLEVDIAWLTSVKCSKDTNKTDLAQVSTHKERVCGIYALYGLSERDCR